MTAFYIKFKHFCDIERIFCFSEKKSTTHISTRNLGNSLLSLRQLPSTYFSLPIIQRNHLGFAIAHGPAYFGLGPAYFRVGRAKFTNINTAWKRQKVWSFGFISERPCSLSKIDVFHWKTQANLETFKASWEMALTWSLSIASKNCQRCLQTWRHNYST